MITSFLFETSAILEEVFPILISKKISYSYFSADDKYYLFIYSEITNNFDFLNDHIDIIQELDFRQRQIRAPRGFILFALEIMAKAKKFKVLKTNLNKFFWKNVERVISQNKKYGLEKFLIEMMDTPLTSKESDQNIKAETEINFNYLQEKIEFLEKRIFSLEDITSSASNDLEGYKITDQEYSTLKTKGEDFKPAFKSLKEISENDKIEIIKRGFDLRREKNISLKDYYERGLLFDWKKYNLKYDSIRQTNLFKKLKDEKLNYSEELFNLN